MTDEDIMVVRRVIGKKEVKQTLRRVDVSPKLAQIHREGGMSYEMMMSFAHTTDHRTQEKTWEHLPRRVKEGNFYLSVPRQLEKRIAADSELAQFVGLEAYEAAGGAVMRDLFCENFIDYLADGVLLNKLAEEKRKKLAARRPGRRHATEGRKTPAGDA